ncbi:MAG: UvrB/UvrC motif-containing protein, partial [Pseudomonadota bacterium]|nr:UvrB/UvrC motif-containing protein [Pseudomonadota bacterium]
RSGTTLIQTIGRAARNLNGKAILYGDDITNSMQYAIDETERRRKKQNNYNKEHKITPTGIKKNIIDIMEGAHTSKKLGNKKIKNIERSKLENVSPEFMLKKIKNLEERMYRCARDLEFEEAAKLRDQIEFLQNNFLGFEYTDIV